MTRERLTEQRVLIPEEKRRGMPESSPRQNLLTIIATAGFVAAALMIWFGQGTVVTFLGMLLFVIDLGFFLYVGAVSIGDQYERLRRMGIGGDVVGLEELEDPTAAVGDRAHQTSGSKEAESSEDPASDFPTEEQD